MSNSSDYISRMVSETLGEVGEESGSNLLSFPAPPARGEAKARLDRRRGCVAITFQEKILEIPVGWGPLKRLGSLQDEFCLSITRDSDPSLLLETIRPFFGFEIMELTLEGSSKGLKLKLETSQGLQSAA